MSEPIDRDLIVRLLQEESLSYREIARRSGASDWSVRSVARKLSGDDRPMRRRPRGSLDDGDQGSGRFGLAVFAGAVALFGGLLWLASRAVPPSDF